MATTRPTATYSPDDNKLRIYPITRLDAETYARVKAAGYIWAPKQDCFVAPMWTPGRADVALDLAGEIDDEDRTLLERAEERADRFDGYSTSRTQDAERARRAVASISEHIPFGQPILVGHHSEARARKDAERIENNMRRAVKAFETAEYWTRRAAGAIAAAKYKERPDVRARRIKTIEADRRKVERNVAAAQQHLRNYAAEGARTPTDRYPQGILHAYLCSYGGGLGHDDAERLRSGEITLDEAVARATANQTAYLATAARWLEHYDFRLAYERAMLAEQMGQTIEQVMAPAPRRQSAKAALPLLNYNPADGSIRVRNPYSGEAISYPVEAMTKAEFAKISDDYKGTRISADGTHRVRTAMRAGCRLVAVFLTDSKAHPLPTAAA